MDHRDDDLSDVVVSKGPCLKCGSKDNLVTYADGHAHCYSAGCKHFVKAGGTTPEVKAKAREIGFGSQGHFNLLDPSKQQDAWGGLPARNLTADTCRRYGIFRAGFKGMKAQAYPYYDQQGVLVSQKVRLPDKEFVVLKEDGAPGLQECQLFGQHVFGERFDRTVVVTEGELDAPSVAQATANSKGFSIACVSINTGAGNAAKCLKKNWLWLNRFSDIVLWFDDDEQGRAAIEECAPLFPGKVRVAKASGFKDASDVLQANKPGDIVAAIYAAQTWRRRGIVNANDNVSDILSTDVEDVFWNYPPSMPKLNEMLGGIRRGEVIYHVAGTGVGKSTQLKEIGSHLVEQGAKVGFLFFEDSIREAKMGLMSIKANELLDLVPMPKPNDTKGRAAYDKRMTEWHTAAFGSGQIELFDPQSADWSMEAILEYCRYMVIALGCDVLELDPLSFVVAGIELTADERRVLDKVAGEFSKLCKELDINMQISHHLRRVGNGIPHEEGAPTSLNELRSSGGLANFAMAVVGWERNNQAEGEAWRVTQGRVIKPARRPTMGVKSGLADVLYYDTRGRLIPSPIPFPPMGKPKEDDGDGSRQRAGGFGHSSEQKDY